MSTFSRDLSVEMPPLSELGEMPTVQEHFQTVLKQRLQIEAEKQPPLFPWETSFQEYPVDISVAAPEPWLSQLKSLQLPTQLPEEILQGLLKRCREIVLDSLQPGIQLVKATESLFTEQPQVMNQVAGLVLASSTVRDSTNPEALESLKAAFPAGYEGANPQQQITLAMLAAKDILDALTIVLTPNQPTVTREWLTTEGKIVLTASYLPAELRQISLTVGLPRAGQVEVPVLGQTEFQEQPGPLNLTLPLPQAGEAISVKIYFNDIDAVPLVFAVRWVDGAA